MFCARNRLLAKRQQRVEGDVERRLRPGNPDNGDDHDDGCNDPAERHPQTAAHDPRYVEQKGKNGHSPAPHTCPGANVATELAPSTPGRMIFGLKFRPANLTAPTR